MLPVLGVVVFQTSFIAKRWSFLASKEESYKNVTEQRSPTFFCLWNGGICVLVTVYFYSRAFQIEEDLTARINMADYKFSFHEKGKEYNPASSAPEGTDSCFQSQCSFFMRLSKQFCCACVWNTIVRFKPTFGHCVSETKEATLRLLCASNCFDKLNKQEKVMRKGSNKRKLCWTQLQVILPWATSVKGDVLTKGFVLMLQLPSH